MKILARVNANLLRQIRTGGKDLQEHGHTILFHELVQELQRWTPRAQEDTDTPQVPVQTTTFQAAVLGDKVRGGEGGSQRLHSGAFRNVNA